MDQPFLLSEFFPAKIFSGILEKGNLSEQEKILAGKNSLSKKVFSLSKKGFPKLHAIYCSFEMEIGPNFDGSLSVKNLASRLIIEKILLESNRLTKWAEHNFKKESEPKSHNRK
jgi:hypothetical protein